VNLHPFPPPRRRGTLLHALLLTVLAGLSGWGFLTMSRLPVGPTFMVWLLVAFLAFIPIPILAYRLYSLSRASYRLGRDTLALRWGLRVEDIPLSDIEWVRPAADLTHPLRYPLLSLSGAILGLRRHQDLGLVEYIASEQKNMLLVATARRVFAISPADARGFVQAFARATELGSLSPSEARSIYPTFVVARAWDSGLARFLWLVALSLNIGLLAWVSVIIPSVAQVPLHINAGAGIVETVPSVQLIILPLASAALNLIGWLAGLSFYRWERQRPLAFAVWISGALSSLAFLIAVMFIISTPV